MTFNGNTATGSSSAYGGAIYGDEDSTITLSNNGSVTFSGNTATSSSYSAYGGAIYGSSSSTITLRDNESVVFSENTASSSSSAAYGGAIYGDTITLSNNGSVTFSGNTASGRSYAYGGAIYASGNLSIQNNEAVEFYQNAEVDGGVYRLRSIYADAGSGDVISLSAAAGKNITFRDSIYIGSGSTFKLNERYEGKAQQGDIVFTGATTVDDLYAVKGNVAGTEEEILLSRITEVNTMTNLYGGRLRVEDGVVYKGNGITAMEGSAATVRVQNATLSHEGYDLTFNAGTTLELVGNNIISGNLQMMEGSILSFDASETTGVTCIDGDMSISGALTIANADTWSGENALLLWVAGMVTGSNDDNITVQGQNTLTWIGNDLVLNYNAATFDKYFNDEVTYTSSQQAGIYHHFERIEFENITSSSNGGAIYGDSYSTITLRDNESVVFSGNTASGSDYVYGGAIYGDSYSTITLAGNESVMFSGNTASGSTRVYGGAIYGGSYSTTITLKDNESVVFSENTASGSSSVYGGAIYGGSYSTTITLAGNESVTFSGNTASGSFNAYGGAIYGGSSSTIALSNNGSVTFSGNTASGSSTSSGGAIYTEGNLSIQNNESVEFYQNAKVAGGVYRLLSIYAGGSDDVISLSAAAGKSITFRDSIYIRSGSTFKLNEQYEGQAQLGDIIFTGATTVDDLYAVKGNVAGTAEEIHNSRTSEVYTMTNLYGGRLRVEEGAVYKGNGITAMEGSAATVRVQNATLSHEGNDLTFNAGTTLELAGNNIISGNVQMMEGSILSFDASETTGVTCIDGDMSISGALTIANADTWSGENTLLLWVLGMVTGSNDDNITVQGQNTLTWVGNDLVLNYNAATFDKYFNDEVTYTSSQQAGIYHHFERIEFENITSSSNGGAIYGDSYSTITLSNNGSVTFSGNTASGSSRVYGGAIYGYDYSTITLAGNESVTFSGNTASGSINAYGGAIYGNWDSTITLRDNESVVFSGNTASSSSSSVYGGAIYGDTITLSNNGSVTFSGNNATGPFASGGAIYGVSSSTITLAGNESVTFTGNTASSRSSAYGGAIYTYAYGDLSIQNNESVEFYQNAEVEGGVYRLRSIYAYGGSGGVISLSAAAGKNITFRDSIYIGEGSSFKLNEAYEGMPQQGDIIFTGATTVDDLYAVKGYVTGTEEEIINSRTSEVYTMTNLYGGRLRVEDGAVYKGNGITAVEGSAATVRVQNATLSHEGYALTFNAGTTLELAGNNTISGNVQMLEGSTLRFISSAGGELTTHTGSLNVAGAVVVELQRGQKFGLGEIHLGLFQTNDSDRTWNPTSVRVIAPADYGEGVVFAMGDVEWVDNVFGISCYATDTVHWNNAAGDGLWNNSSANWVSGGYSFARIQGTHVILGATGQGEITLVGDIAQRSLTVENGCSYELDFATDASLTVRENLVLGSGSVLTVHGDMAAAGVNAQGTLVVDGCLNVAGGVTAGSLQVANLTAGSLQAASLTARTLTLTDTAAVSTIGSSVSLSGAVAVAGRLDVTGSLSAKTIAGDANTLSATSYVSIGGDIAGSDNVLEAGTSITTGAITGDGNTLTADAGDVTLKSSRGNSIDGSGNTITATGNVNIEDNVEGSNNTIKGTSILSHVQSGNVWAGIEGDSNQLLADAEIQMDTIIGSSNKLEAGTSIKVGTITGNNNELEAGTSITSGAIKGSNNTLIANDGEISLDYVWNAASNGYASIVGSNNTIDATGTVNVKDDIVGDNNMIGGENIISHNGDDPWASLKGNENQLQASDTIRMDTVDGNKNVLSSGSLIKLNGLSGDENELISDTITIGAITGDSNKLNAESITTGAITGDSNELTAETTINTGAINGNSNELTGDSITTGGINGTANKLVGLTVNVNGKLEGSANKVTATNIHVNELAGTAQEIVSKGVVTAADVAIDIDKLTGTNAIIEVQYPGKGSINIDSMTAQTGAGDTGTTITTLAGNVTIGTMNTTAKTAINVGTSYGITVGSGSASNQTWTASSLSITGTEGVTLTDSTVTILGAVDATKLTLTDSSVTGNVDMNGALNMRDSSIGGNITGASSAILENAIITQELTAGDTTVTGTVTVGTAAVAGLTVGTGSTLTAAEGVSASGALDIQGSVLAQSGNISLTGTDGSTISGAAITAENGDVVLSGTMSAMDTVLTADRVVVAEDAAITSDLTLNAALNMDSGAVIGGSVTGATNATLTDSIITGALGMNGELNMTNASAGSVTGATNATLTNATIDGNLSMGGELNMDSGAVIGGNLSMGGELNMDSGAVIGGSVTGATNATLTNASITGALIATGDVTALSCSIGSITGAADVTTKGTSMGDVSLSGNLTMTAATAGSVTGATNATLDNANIDGALNASGTVVVDGGSIGSITGSATKVDLDNVESIGSITMSTSGTLNVTDTVTGAVNAANGNTVANATLIDSMIGSGLNVTDTLDVIGDAGVAGNVTAGDLNVSDGTLFATDGDTLYDVTVKNKTTLSNGEVVAGNFTTNELELVDMAGEVEKLIAEGNVAMAGTTLGVTKTDADAVKVGGSMTLTQGAILTNAGGAQITGDLEVDGSAFTNDGAVQAGSIAVKDGGVLTGTTVTANGVTVTNGGTLAGVVNSTGAVTVTNGTITGAVTGEGVSVSGGEIAGNVTVSQDAVTVSKEGSIAGSVDNASTVTLSGASSILGSVTNATGKVTLAGGSTIGGNVTTGGDVEITGTTSTIGGKVTANGVTVTDGSIAGGVAATGAVSVTNGTITGAVLADSAVLADATFGSGLSVTHDMEVAGQVSAQGSVTVGGKLTGTGMLDLAGALTVGSLQAGTLETQMLTLTTQDSANTVSGDLTAGTVSLAAGSSLSVGGALTANEVQMTGTALTLTAGSFDADRMNFVLDRAALESLGLGYRETSTLAQADAANADMTVTLNGGTKAVQAAAYQYTISASGGNVQLTADYAHDGLQVWYRGGWVGKSSWTYFYVAGYDAVDGVETIDLNGSTVSGNYLVIAFEDYDAVSIVKNGTLDFSWVDMSGGQFELGEGAALRTDEITGAEESLVLHDGATLDAGKVTLGTLSLGDSDVTLRTGESTISRVLGTEGTLNIGAGASVTVHSDVALTGLNNSGILNLGKNALVVNALVELGGDVTASEVDVRCMGSKMASFDKLVADRVTVENTVPVGKVYDAISIGAGSAIGELVAETLQVREGTVTLGRTSGSSKMSLLNLDLQNDATLVLNQQTTLKVTDTLTATENATVQLKQNASVSYDGMSISNRKESALSVNAYALSGEAELELNGAHVAATGSGDKVIDYKLVNSTVENAGSGTLQVTHAENSLSGVVASSGNVEVYNVTGTMSLDELRIATGLSVSLLTGADGTPVTPATEANVTVVGLAVFEKGATLNANLTMAAGSELRMEGPLHMGSTLELVSGADSITLGGSMLDAVAGMQLGDSMTLFTGVDALVLTFDGVSVTYQPGDIQASDRVLASDYFGNLPVQGANQHYYITFTNTAVSGGELAFFLAPEPTTTTLSLLALTALAARRRRK